MRAPRSARVKNGRDPVARADMRGTDSVLRDAAPSYVSICLCVPGVLARMDPR